MRRLARLTIVTVAAAVCLVALTAQVPAQQVDPIQAAIAGMGSANVKSVRFSGFGAIYSVGQSPSPREPWRRVTLKNYEVDIDYSVPSMRVQLTREQEPISPWQGRPPFTGEQRSIQFVNGRDAWDLEPAAAPATPQARPEAVAERIQQIRITPHGFLRAARSNGATSRQVPLGTEISFTVDGKRFVGILDSQNQLERVETWTDHPGLGSVSIETIYRDYERLEGGFLFPTHMTQRRQGLVWLDVWLSSVQANVPVEFTTPGDVKDVSEGAGK